MFGPLQLERHDDVPVGRLNGEIDISQVPIIRDRLYGALDNQGSGMLIDLSEAKYIDSAVVNLLFELADRLGTHQLRLALVVPEGGLVDRVLTIVNIGSVADVHRHFDEAIEALSTDHGS